MKKFLNPRNAVLVFAFVGFSGIGISSFVGQASASMLDECRASSKIKVVACCKQHIERFGRPIWMSNGEDNNCRSAAVKCVAKKVTAPFAATLVVVKKPYCFLEVPVKEGGGGGGEHPYNPPSNNTPDNPNTPGIIGTIALVKG